MDMARAQTTRARTARASTTRGRMHPSDGVAFLTGASSGIGRAVALELARRGWTVAASSRRLDALERLAADAAGLPGRVVAHAADVTDARAMAQTVLGVERVHGPIALAFFNAGMAPAMTDELDFGAFEQAFAVNVIGVVKGLAPVLAAMKSRRRGQIAVNASLAGYGGLPQAVAYGASKAAAIHLCEALALDCDRFGLRIQVVNPGFVETPLTARNDFPMPFMLSAEQAARRIVDGFEHGGFEITFPRRLAFVLKCLNMLPYPAYYWLIAKAAGWRGRPPDP